MEMTFWGKMRLSSYILEHERGKIYTMSHSESSKYLCISYRHLLHVFKELENEGVIERKSCGLYMIKNKKRLEKESIEC